MEASVLETATNSIKDQAQAYTCRSKAKILIEDRDKPYCYMYWSEKRLQPLHIMRIVGIA